jgi:hypothetical protein
MALSAIVSRGVFALKIAAGALLAAMVALAIMNYQEPEPSVAGFESANNETIISNNETIIYRRAAPPPARLQGSDVADRREEAGSSYPRADQGGRFRCVPIERIRGAGKLRDASQTRHRGSR